MRLIVLFIFCIIIQFGCAGNCNLDEHNKYESITDSDIMHLEKNNKLILSYSDTLINMSTGTQWKDSNKKDSLEARNNFYFAQLPEFESYLSKCDSLEFRRHYSSINDCIRRKLCLNAVNLRLSDSTFEYKIQSEICDNDKQETTVNHYLLFRTNPFNYIGYKTEDWAKEKH